MTKRSLKQIEESLRSKFAETSDDDINAFAQSIRDLEDPYHLGGSGKPQQIDIGLGGAARGVSSKPRVSLQKAKELGIVKPDPKVWRRASDVPTLTDVIPAAQPKVWRRGEPSTAEKSSIAPAPQTPQEKLVAQAQQRAQETGEPTVAVTNPTVSKILDRLFPEKLSDLANKRIEPTLDEDKDSPAMQKFLDRVIGPESGGKLSIKNPWSPATGLFQFMPKTWEGIVKKAKPGDPHYGVTFDQMKTNAAAQMAAAKAISQEYATGIRRSGMPNIPTSYYLFHGHGPKAVKLYTTAATDPKATLQDIYPEYVKNPKTGKIEKNIVYVQNKNWKPDQNLRSFVAARARTMGDKLTDIFPSAQAGELPPDRRPAADAEVVPSKKEIKKPVEVPADKSTPARDEPKTAAPAAPAAPAAADTKLTSFLDKAAQPDFKTGTMVSNPFITPMMMATDYLSKKLSGNNKETTEQPKTRQSMSGTVTYPKKPAAVPKPDKIDLQRDQRGLVTAKKLSDFEQAFATARTEKGPGETFTWYNPRKGKTETFSTSYKGEKPTAKPPAEEPQAAAAPELSEPRDRIQPPADRPAEPAASSIQKSLKDFERKQDIDRIVKQANEPVGTPAPKTDAEIKSDELWAPLRKEWDALSPEEQQSRVRDAKVWAAGFEPIDKAEPSTMKESINTASSADLHDILRLAGRLK